MFKPVLIGLCGKGGAGKSSFAQAVRDHIVGPCVISSFGTALKELARKIGWNGEKDEKGRRVLQLLGTDICRECIDPDYWTKEWYRRVSWDLTIGNSIVVDDVRFPNEVTVIREAAVKRGYVSHILHLVTPLQKEVMDSKAQCHISENALDGVGYDRSICMEFGLNHVKTAAKEFLDDIGMLKL